MSHLLSGIQLHDHLFIDGKADILPGRQRSDRSFEAGAVQLQPFRDTAPVNGVQGSQDGHEVPAFLSDLDNVADFDQRAWYVCPPPVQKDMAVIHQLPRFFPRGAKTQTINNVVEPTLKQAKQGLTSDPRLSLGPFEKPSELPLLQPIDPSQLLLFS
jgi:hypothetical protein